MAIDYQTDFYAWAQHQAALLKTGKQSELDIKHLVEEIEDMSRNEKRAMESRLMVLLVHLLKWKYQPHCQGISRKLMIEEQRLRLSKDLETSPSLAYYLELMAADAYEIALLKAARETKLSKTMFPPSCPWSSKQLLDKAYYPSV